MSLDYADRLGERLGKTNTDQHTIQGNIEGDDPAGIFNFTFIHPIKMSLGIRIIKKNLPANGFVMDHPVYSELNNVNLPFNEDYGGFDDGTFTFPATFPITFTGGSVLEATELIYEDNF